MGRTSYALLSLTAAVPGALLVLLLVMGFLQHADKMPGMLSVVAGLTLLVAAMLAVTPVGILLFGGPKSARAEKSAPVAESESAEGSSQEPMESQDSLAADEELDVITGDAASEWEEEESGAEFSESLVDEFEFDESGEIDADFDFDEDEKR